MRTSERMRRRGWRLDSTRFWGKRVAGAYAFAWEFGALHAPVPSGFSVIVNGIETTVWCGWNSVVYCAQRAEALAKRLAKKRKAAR